MRRKQEREESSVTFKCLASAAGQVVGYSLSLESLEEE